MVCLALAVFPYVLAVAYERGWLPPSHGADTLFGGGDLIIGVLVTLAFAIGAWRESIAAMNSRAPGTVASPASSAVFVLSVFVTIGTALTSVALLIIN